MDRDAIALFRVVADRPPAEREAYYTRHRVAAAMRDEVESLLKYDRETVDPIHGRMASAAARMLVPDRISTATSEDRPDDGGVLRSDTGEGRFPAGTLLDGRYRVISLLGRGGMGEVYRAIDLTLKQPVALKFLPENMARDPRLLERLHVEARLARQISHPNVCRVYDIGEVAGVTYISMEYIDGEDLATLLRRIGRLPYDKGLDIARRLCAGLAAAHDKGVIHRDLKPANIMIDRRGEVLITDFGLARLRREVGHAEARSGTPAYMAPEQLQGQRVSVRSDIYSLGLVFYELFSGRRPFDHTRRPQDTPPSITSVTREIDLAVVRAIGRCIELDPRDRPASALAVAALLPGGNPLAEALAAGVTPSPQAVAASAEGAFISPRAALLNLMFVIGGLAAVVGVGSRLSILHLTPFENAPAVLAQKAREVIATFGYTSPAVDRATGFLIYEGAPGRYAGRRPPLSEQLAQLSRGHPPVITFWYRQSPDYLLPWNAASVVVGLGDPPLWKPGEAFLATDLEGRVVRFEAVVPQEDYSTESNRPGHWDGLFAAAGVDSSRFTRVPPEWISSVTFDDRAAWTGSYAHSPSVPIRIEAASWKGRPVYFDISGPWRAKLSFPRPIAATRSETTALLVAMGLGAAALAGAAFMARRNHRLGRGDVQGAARLAALTFVCGLLYWLLSAHHVTTLRDTSRFFHALATPLLYAAMAWVLYLAIEPYVRRRWPQALIAWTRVLRGRVRDPLVGAHVLIGITVGVAFAVWHTARLWALFQSGFPLVGLPRLSVHVLEGATSTLSAYLWILSASAVEGPAIITVFLLLRALLRRTWAAAIVLILLGSAPFVLSGVQFWIDAAFILPVSAVSLLLLIRFGVLSATVASFAASVLTQFPLTTHVSAWYSGPTLLAVSTVLALGIWSFHVALAGRPLLHDGVLEPA
jgi:serine/threonine-protein kinase